uniref:C1q domain-containing protein n=1 Tax=Oryzias latipes TaxID=8090 RepID=A0A3P9JP39_ORYLA
MELCTFNCIKCLHIISILNLELVFAGRKHNDWTGEPHPTVTIYRSSRIKAGSPCGTSVADMTSPMLLLTFISGLTVVHYAVAGPYEPCPFDPCIVLKEINALKEALEARDVPKVAFSARLAKGGVYGNFQDDITLTFNAVITNFGNAYNPTTGMFTAPVKGLYYFTYFAHGGRTGRIRLQLKKDGTMVADIHIHPSQSNSADNAGNAVFLELEQGNQVYLTLVANSAIWGQGFATTFSGVLLSKS